MTEGLSAHPSPERLAAFRVGNVSPEELTEIERHLAGCPSCCRSLKSLPDDSLVERVERLLAAHPEVGSCLEPPRHPTRPEGPRPPETNASGPPAEEGEGLLAGHYKLLEQIGEGGMGSVWMARQTEPVKRLVAVKLIKQGMDSKAVLARFEAERQALALMDHPNIAKVFDAGATEAGRPYFVMELVHGVPITKYCDDNQLTPRQRLELFVPVCQAIQHAHQKGIIHRDVKPSNVMVTLYDGKPVPKVIDFGVAKATEQKLTERTLFTQYGTLVGTLEYMSPEQAEMSGLGADTRSDIFSLGVLLYELLTGSTPLSHKRLKEATYAEILRMIKEEEPPRPSTRLSDSGEALASISAQRHMEPAQLTKLVRGELDWIVMKTLEKDRNRRYETASGFAADVQRYLNDEPVQACPPSAGYRLRKFARRNKRALAMAAILGLGLFVAVGAVAGSIGWIVRDRGVRQARMAGEVGQVLEGVELLAEEGKWPEAMAAARRAEALLASGEGTDELHQQVRAWLAALGVVTEVEELRLSSSMASFTLDKNDAALADAFRKYGLDLSTLKPEEAALVGIPPSVRAELATAMDVWALRGLEAMRLTPATRSADRWQRLLAVTPLIDPDPWRNQLRDILRRQDRPGLQQFAADADVERLPARSCEILGDALESWGQREAAARLLRAVQRRFPDDVPINSLLAFVLANMSPPGLDEALRYQTAVLALRPRSFASHNNLGILLGRKQEWEASVVACREAVRLQPNSGMGHNNLGLALEGRGDLGGALDAYDRAIRLEPDIPHPHANRGDVLRRQGDLAGAEVSLRQAVRLSPGYANAHYLLGRTLEEKRDFAGAMKCYQVTISLGAAQDMLVNACVNLGNCSHALGRFDDAVHNHGVAIRLNPRFAPAHYNLGNARLAKGDPDGALAAYREALTLTPDDADTHYSIGQALDAKDDRTGALAAYREALRLKADHALAHTYLGKLLEAQGRREDAITHYRQAIRSNPRLFQAHFNLGLALLAADDVDGAIQSFQAATVADPKNAVAWYNLGHSLEKKNPVSDKALAAYREAARANPEYAKAHIHVGLQLGKQARFAEALDSLRQGHELGSKIKGWSVPSARLVRECERLLELDGRLPAVLRGEDTPATAAEGIKFAELCAEYKQLYGAAARLYQKAFEAEPVLAEGGERPHRVLAACAAAQAGCGPSKDVPPLDETARAHWRKQALDWLGADLARHARMIMTGGADAGAQVGQQLQDWRQEPSLAGLRDADALARLPEAEREACRKLWVEVETLLARVKPKGKDLSPDRP
jgi:eukaryotic-like serine/threonine-protein kinase